MAISVSGDDGQQDDAQAALQFRSQVAALSHDLRAPFNAIIGFSEALKDGLVGEMSAVQKEYIGEIFSSAQYLLSLVNGVLEFSSGAPGASLPRIERAAAQPRPGAHKLVSDAAGLRLHGAGPGQRVALVVEDDDLAAELMCLLLQAEGFFVLRAFSAEEAFFLAPRQSLALITLDIRLPGVDGWEFLRQIRADAALKQVPVMIVSGAADILTALDGGASALLLKPISRTRLQVSLAELGLQAGGPEAKKKQGASEVHTPMGEAHFKRAEGGAAIN